MNRKKRKARQNYNAPKITGYDTKSTMSKKKENKNGQHYIGN